MSRAIWTPQYYQRVLATNPTSHFMLDEKSGTVAYEMVSGRAAGAQNGAHTGVTLGQPGIGDGRTSPYYDGTNDYTNILTAAFNAAFSGAEGSVLIWFLPDPASHGDGTNRYLFRFEVSVSHFVRCQKLGAGSNIQIDYRAGGGAIRTHTIAIAGPPAGFGAVGFTWSTTATISYYNGAVNNSLGGSGAWAGNLATALIGAGSAVPANVYQGDLCHLAVWDRVLSADEFASLYDAAPLVVKPSYVEKVKSTRAANLIAYWPQWEGAGAVAYDQINAAQNGAYTGVTLGQTGIGDGNTCPLYDGTNDYTDVFSAALAAAFNGSEGTMMVWAQVSGVGVWTDGAFRLILEITDDASNRMALLKSNANNRLTWYYSSGGVAQNRNKDGVTTTGWMCVLLTWSKTADEVIAYFDGAREGAVMSGLGVWVGPIVNAVIGATDVVPNNVWDGTLAHCAVWDVALTPAEIANLAVIP